MQIYQQNNCNNIEIKHDFLSFSSDNASIETHILILTSFKISSKFFIILFFYAFLTYLLMHFSFGTYKHSYKNLAVVNILVLFVLEFNLCSKKHTQQMRNNNY